MTKKTDMWMPIYIGDYLADTGHLTTTQHGAYLLLLMHYWRKRELPVDDKQLAAIAKLPLRIWLDTKETLQAFFHDGWKHKRLEEEIQKRLVVSEKRAAAGSEGGKSRGKKEANASVLLKQTGSMTQSQLPSEAKASAPTDPEAELFRRAREVLGKQGGGLTARLLAAKQKNIALARAAIEQASTKSDPREYIGAIIRGPQAGAQPNWLDGIEGVL
jgi:uncharacterized protein YdaU (DUF1376 family)